MANEIDFDFGTLQLDNTNNISVAEISVKEKLNVAVHSIPKSEGSIVETAKRDSLIISVKGDIAGSDYDDLRTNIDALKAGLFTGKQKFTTDDDRYIMAQIKDFSFKYEWIRTLATWQANFLAHFPFWLSETETTDTRTPTSGAGYTIANNGNAATRVKIEVTAPGGGITDDCQIENTTLGQLLKYRGTIAASDVLEIDNRYDTDDYEVLNDGTDDHTNFEGDFITLDPGNNTIEFTGTASTQIKLYYRDAWY